MPDRSEVEQSLAELVAGILYPEGAEGACAAGCPCRVYRGWPVAGRLENDLAQGIAHVTVQPVAGTIRDRTRYSSDWQGIVPESSMSASVSGERVIFSGTAAPGQVAGIRVDGLPYAYRPRAGDTTALVAAALAAQIRANRPALASESSVFVLNGRGIVVRVVSDGQGGRELRRQQAGFRLTFWCPNPMARDLAVGLVDAGAAGRTFIDVAGWACRLQLSGESSADDGSAAGIWRRDLIYMVEYPTTAIEVLPAMLFGFSEANNVTLVA